MVVAAADITEYRHRRETKREQDLRLEVCALADSIAEFDRRTRPHRQRFAMVAREIGPTAFQSYAAIEYEVQRLLAQAEPESDSIA